MTLKNKTVLYQVENSVARITMNRPEVKNAINKEMHEELYEAFQAARHDQSVRVIILTGTDGSFSSGADIKSIPIQELDSFDHGDYLEETYNQLLLLIDEIEKPIVAYINGTAVGAGLSLALACDFRYAEHDAKIALSFIQIGLTPDAGSSYFLPRLIGLGKALELSLGETITAEEALRIGLINQIGVPDEFIKKLTSVPLTAYSWMKHNMKAGMHLSLREVLDLEVEGQRASGMSNFHRKAVMQFVSGQK
ncbi:enoyl-CoA hydratase/isomerase family protein [Bacillus shivajii]|uniref:enoyl-CoA hydratase/isomerase family protein n=1 Tax=Bacillus shivajii TaxID=1983719 RepID=UPI001CFC3605|nr:enoyl-CoA hydratase-related protein [Bacillus shivajii]UCZ53079.1 enoyl-CoA hydratase/isomerase family protein [Bacillus shivajii]